MRHAPSPNGANGRAGLLLSDRTALRRLLDHAVTAGDRVDRERFLANFQAHFDAFADSLGPGTREAFARQFPEYLGGSHRPGDRMEGTP
jgi:hypothetical protein